MLVKPERYFNVQCQGSINRLFVEVKKGEKPLKDIANIILEKPDLYRNRKGVIDGMLIMAEFNLSVSRAYAVKKAVEKTLAIEEDKEILKPYDEIL